MHYLNESIPSGKAPEAILVNGYGSNFRKLNISSSYGDMSVTVEQLSLARRSKSCPIPIENEYLEVKLPTKIPNISITLPHIFRQNLYSMSCQKLEGDNVCGVIGMRGFQNDFLRYYGSVKDKSFSEFSPLVLFAYYFADKRERYARFLLGLDNTVSDCDEMRLLLQGIWDTAKSYKTVAEKLLEIQITNNRNLLKTVTQYWGMCIELEEKNIRILSALLQNVDRRIIPS
ncbi:hypothetical protein HY605_02845 [Candidatus Peregrinibacteria bacterium]|nr:hypothetical protein [Candidatus Peregrinibacteria bacterium]